MRILLLTRGLPGSGKSTWIRESGLETYTISTDRLRLLYSAPQLGIDGAIEVSQKVNRIIFKTLVEMLETRMENGDLSVIDACHTRTADFDKYKDLVKTYRYRVVMKDFSGVGLAECKRRNMLRPELERLPEHAIDRMNRQLSQCRVPGWIQVFSHDQKIAL
ncbi:MAG: AAA family ATPase [Succinivibrionaceae bacterium]|nr:AAA family ATPase [Succinivibrionaceae bacterium]